MDIGVMYRDFGAVPIAGIVAYVARCSAADWRTNLFRQARYVHHHMTESIVFRLPLKQQDFPGLTEFQPLLAPLLARLAPIYPDWRRLSGCMLVKLRPGAQVLPHQDTAPYFAQARRFHVPILTNDRVQFTLHDERLHMQTGHLYEINNVVGQHAVVNGGVSDRVHLIFDLERENAASDH